MKTVFALTSWGNAGAPWIIAGLNRHPMIKAVSNLSQAGYSPLQRQLSTTDYLDAIGRMFWPERAVCGDVHGVSPHEFPELHETFGPIFRGAHLIGHPVQRLAGSLAYSREAGRDWRYRHFVEMWDFPPDEPRAQAALAILGEDGDYIPANYMVHVNNVYALCGVDGPSADPLFRLEDLLVSDQAWAELVGHLSGGVLQGSGGYWQALQGQVMNVAQEPFASTPRAVWDSFDPYVRALVAGVLTDEARAVYEALGYDLSFVR